MTKRIAIALASLTLVACAADADERNGGPGAVGNGETSPAPSADEPCPSEPATTGPRKTPGLVEKCAGDYECNGGRGYGPTGIEVSLHFDGTTCRVAENPGDDLVLQTDGRVVLEGKDVGAWTGDAVAFEYTHTYDSGHVTTFRCRPQPSTR